MKLTQMRAKTETEIKELIQTMKKDMETHASEVIKGKEKNTTKIVFLKRDLARVKTILNEKLFLKGTKND